jgi:small subunit ribosomal protein S5
MLETGHNNWDYKVLEVKRVTKVIPGGKRFKLKAVVVAGDRQGRVGLGIGKANDLALAVEKARRLARKNSIKVPIVNQTIPYEVEAKVKTSRVLLKPAPAGHGLIASGVVRAILDLCGIENVTSKLLGKTKNNFNNSLAILAALKKLTLYVQDVDKPDQVQTETF